MPDRKLQLIISVANLASTELKKIASDVQAVAQAASGLNQFQQSIGQVEQTITTAASKLQGLAQSLIQTFVALQQQLTQIVGAAERLSKVKAPNVSFDMPQSSLAAPTVPSGGSAAGTSKPPPVQEYKVLNQELGQTQKQLDKVAQSADKADQELEDAASQGGKDFGGAFQSIQSGATGAFGAVSQIAFGFNQIVAAVQTAIGAVKPFFDNTIGAAEKLNEQILSSQTNLANAVTIKVDGKELTSSLDKIQATRGFIEDLTKQVEKDTADLAGVTSEQVTGVLDVVIRNTGAIVGQFDTSKRDLKGAISGLVKGFTAELRLSNLDLGQAQQELTSLLAGQLGPDSLIGRKLGFSNDEVRKLQGQGRLIEEVLARLDGSITGNQLLSRSSPSAQFTNIIDVLQIIGREAGKPLLEPLANSLKSVYDSLVQGQDAAVAFAQNISQGLSNAFAQLGQSIQGLLPQLQQIGADIFANLQKGFQGFAQNILPGLQKSLQNLAPAFETNFKQVLSLFQFFANSIGTSADDVGKLFGSLLNAVTGVLSPIVTAINLTGTAIIRVFDAILNNPIVDFLRGQFVGAVASVLNAIGDFGRVLTTGIVAGFEQLEKAATGVSRFFGGIVNAVSPVIEAFEPLLNFLGAIGDAFGAFINAQIQAYLQTLSGQFQLLSQVVGTAANILGTALKPAFDLLGVGLNQVGGAIKNSLKSFSEFQKGAIDKVVGTVEALVSNPAFKALAKVLGLDSKAIQAGLDQLKSSLNDTGKQAGDVAGKVDAAGKQAGEGFKAAGKDAQFGIIQAEKLGTSYAQLRKRIENNQRVIEQNAKGEGLTKAFEDQVKALQEAAELGIVDPKVAQERLEAIAANESASFEAQKAAAEGITKLRKIELDKQKVDLDAQITEVETSIANGQTNEVEGAKQITALKKQQLDEQLADLEESISKEEEAIASGRGSANRLQQLRTQQRQVTAQREREEVEGERRIQAARITEIEKAEKQATEALEDSEQQRKIILAKAKLDRTKLAEEINLSEIEGRQRFLDAQLKLEQESLAKLQALPRQSDPKSEEERQAKIRESRRRTGDLTLQLLESEEQKQKAIADVIRKRIQIELDKFKNQVGAENLQLQQQLDLQEAIGRSLDAQQKLLNARIDLQRSLSDLSQSQYDNSIRLLEAQFAAEDKAEESAKRREELEKRIAEAKTPEERDQAQEELAKLEKQEAREKQLNALRIEAKQAEIAQAEILFQLEVQRNQLEEQKTQLLREQEAIRLRQQKLDAAANTAEAQANLATLRAEGARPEQIEAAQQKVTAAQARQASLVEQERLNEQLGQQESLFFEQQRQVAAIGQQSRIQGLQTELATLGGNPQQLAQLQQTFLNQARATSTQVSQSPLAGQLAQAQQLIASQPVLIQPMQQPVVAAAQQRSAPDQIVSELRQGLTDIKQALLQQQPTQITIPTTVNGVNDPSAVATVTARRIESQLIQAFQSASR